MNLGAKELYARLLRGDPTFLLDVRAPKEFERWRVEGPRELPSLNVPYTRILADADEEDIPRAAAEYAETKLQGKIPKGPLVVVVCAKGGASAPVAEGLRAAGYDAANLDGGMLAWGDHYETLPIVDEPGLAILQVSRPARGCLSWIAISEGEAIVVDALRHVEPYVAAIEERGASLVAVVDTHAHADHVSGGRALADEAGAAYYLHPYDAIHPIDMLPARLEYVPLHQHQTLAVGETMLDVLHVPGHTLGAVALLLDDRFLFAGDTLFVGGIARPDLGGRAETWTPLHQDSLRRLLALDPKTVVLPGHFHALAEADARGAFAPSLAALRERNAGAREALGDPEAFSRYILSSLPAFPPAYVEIKRVNLGLPLATPAEPEVLELGKNLCALTGR